jgi:hypothetical protein
MTDWATTHRLAARITLAEGAVIEGDLHLQPRVAWRDGPELPVEMLNREDAFFPVTLEAGEILFVAKAQVAALLCRTEPVPADPAREHAARLIPLEVVMVGGAEYRGVALSELPPAHSRALDFLNARQPFFDLHTADGALCLNRQFVRAVRPGD